MDPMWFWWASTSTGGMFFFHFYFYMWKKSISQFNFKSNFQFSAIFSDFRSFHSAAREVFSIWKHLEHFHTERVYEVLLTCIGLKPPAYLLLDNLLSKRVSLIFPRNNENSHYCMRWRVAKGFCVGKLNFTDCFRRSTMMFYVISLIIPIFDKHEANKIG